MSTNREDIETMLLHYGYPDSRLAEIVDTYASALAEDLRKTKVERDRLASWVLLRCPNCNYIMAPAEQDNALWRHAAMGLSGDYRVTPEEHADDDCPLCRGRAEGNG